MLKIVAKYREALVLHLTVVIPSSVRRMTQLDCLQMDWWSLQMVLFVIKAPNKDMLHVIETYWLLKVIEIPTNTSVPSAPAAATSLNRP